LQSTKPPPLLERQVRNDQIVFERLFSHETRVELANFQKLHRKWSIVQTQMNQYLNVIIECIKANRDTDLPKAIGFQDSLSGLLSGTLQQYSLNITRFIYYLQIIHFKLSDTLACLFRKVTTEFLNSISNLDPSRLTGLKKHEILGRIQEFMTLLLKTVEERTSDKLKSLAAGPMVFFSLQKDCSFAIASLSKPLTALKFVIKGSVLLSITDSVDIGYSSKEIRFII